jgi:2-succinyl-6-hydroxy-2,4-cyclohexadiene-1-carboxylate synthase
VAALVLIGAHPGIEDAGERVERQVADARLADRVEAIGVEAFLDEWLAQPLFASLPAEASERSARAANTAAGLASALRTLSPGVQAPLWNRLPALEMPVLLLAGELDHKYVRIVRQAAAAIGANATFRLIPGAGHAVHLERPHATAEVVLEFLVDQLAPHGEPDSQ